VARKGLPWAGPSSGFSLWLTQLRSFKEDTSGGLPPSSSPPHEASGPPLGMFAVLEIPRALGYDVSERTGRSGSARRG
jgi:hypothetical protein